MTKLTLTDILQFDLIKRKEGREMEKQLPRGRGGYLEALLSSCPVAILATDAEGKITFANKEASKLADRELRELVGQSIATIYESLEAARETNRKLYQKGGIIRDHESRAKTKTGKLIPVRISAAHIYDSSGKYTGAVGYFETYRPWTGEEAKVKAHAEELETELAERKDVGAPVFELYPGLAVVAVIGRLDSNRFERITANPLNHLECTKTKVVILDLTAASVADDGVASQLIKTMRTINLLGVQCVLGGIQAPVARAMEPLVTDLSSVKSFCSIDVALRAALKSLGFEIRKSD